MADFLACFQEPAHFPADDLLASYQIPTAPIKLTRDLHEAESIASEFVYPVVMKIASPDISHKSDVGGVIVDLKDDINLQLPYAQILSRVREAIPEARIERVHLQKQIPPGQEVIVGVVRDPQFGPLMMFGSGGVEVEGLTGMSPSRWRH